MRGSWQWVHAVKNLRRNDCRDADANTTIAADTAVKDGDVTAYAPGIAAYVRGVTAYAPAAPWHPRRYCAGSGSGSFSSSPSSAGSAGVLTESSSS
ncbi:hypothetical protein GCM10009863_63730 [Streptomyces axinellae]|uniref:Uncharacterized protein n=1 Tax=Streptomyces axinellae TaxID=552788 RepID=A0ABP6DC42_9ACTN